MLWSSWVVVLVELPSRILGFVVPSGWVSLCPVVALMYQRNPGWNVVAAGKKLPSDLIAPTQFVLRSILVVYCWLSRICLLFRSVPIDLRISTFQPIFPIDKS